MAIQDIKITSRNPQKRGDFQVYKGKITYIPVADDEGLDTGNIFLWIDKDYDLDEVLAYINKNKHNWKP